MYRIYSLFQWILLNLNVSFSCQLILEIYFTPWLFSVCLITHYEFRGFGYLTYLYQSSLWSITHTCRFFLKLFVIPLRKIQKYKSKDSDSFTLWDCIAQQWLDAKMLLTLTLFSLLSLATYLLDLLLLYSKLLSMSMKVLKQNYAIFVKPILFCHSEKATVSALLNICLVK